MKDPNDFMLTESEGEQLRKANIRIAALEARCREQQEQFDALYSRNVFIEASLASCRAALYDVVHCSLELGVVKRAEMALGLAKETISKSCSDARPQGQEDPVERTHPKATVQAGTECVGGAPKQPACPAFKGTEVEPTHDEIVAIREIDSR